MTDTLRVLLIQEGSWYVAQCVDHDVAAQARTPGGALMALERALLAEATGCRVEDAPAPPWWFQRAWEHGVIHSQRNRVRAMDVRRYTTSWEGGGGYAGMP